MLNFSKLKISIISFICIASVIFAAPSFLREGSSVRKLLPNSKINLGLDLKGGSQLLLRVDIEYYLEEKLKNLRDELRSKFKEDSIRAIARKSQDGKIKIKFFGESDKNSIKKIVYDLSPDIELLQLNDELVLQFSNEQKEDYRRKLISQSIEIIRRRIDESGTKEPTIQSQGKKRILLQVPGVSDSKEVKELLGQTAKMTFHFVSDKTFRASNQTKLIDPKFTSATSQSGELYIIEKEPALSGELLVDANPTYHEGSPAVSFRFNQKGTRKFAKITSENIGRIFAIVLDNKVITAPKINSVINQGNGVITGNFSTKEASNLALLLRAGALPAPLKIIEERTIGPSLGSDSIRSGAYASIISLVLISLTMILFYKSIGVIAIIALFFNICIILSTLSLLGATLTLPGIAGIALTMGMSVDANVLIFERIKEEIKQKKSLFPALESGFSQAFRAIIDANITTLIIAVFLFIFGTGPVKGFAVTLSIGILSSMFCAILLTRMVIMLWIRKTNKKQLNIA